MKKGFFDKRNMAFRKRQREESLRKLIPPVRKKAEEKPIEVKPFNGIGYVNPVNLSDYRYVIHRIDDVIHPSKNLEKAVSCLMVNMLLGLGNDVFEPGKSYSGQERQYTKSCWVSTHTPI